MDILTGKLSSNKAYQVSFGVLFDQAQLFLLVDNKSE